jgi:aspartate/methionine/tyrosine aminotransferase
MLEDQIDSACSWPYNMRIEALTGDQSSVKNKKDISEREIWGRRLQFHRHSRDKPRANILHLGKSSAGFTSVTSAKLIEEKGDCVTPGSGFGEEGEVTSVYPLLL